MSNISQYPIFVVQHTSGEFLGLMEDHLEGRGIRFNYFRPFTAGGGVPATMEFSAGLILLGGGPWGTKGGRAVPTLTEELVLARQAIDLGKPIVGIGLGAQILAIAAGGGSEASELAFELGEASRIRDDALAGFLPETFPLVTFMRDRPVLPPDAQVLAIDRHRDPVLFQTRGNCFGFTGHPGAKAGMAEDLIMEFDELPVSFGETLDRFRGIQKPLEDSLVYIMTGLIQATGWMQAVTGSQADG
jgi:GMP synthase-like glutamine amidotransferase